MKPRRLIIINALLATACSAIGISSPAEVPANKHSRPVSGFDSISFGTIGRLVLVQGSEEFLTIDAPKEIADRIAVAVKDRTLYIGYRGIKRVKGADPIITVGVIDFRKLTASAAGRIEARALRADSISVIVSSSGSVSLDGCELGSIEARLSSSGSLSMTGRARSLDLSCASSGSFRGGSLETRKAAVRLDSSGDAVVWAVDRLDAKLTSKGELSYYGTPDFSLHPSSRAARARPLGRK